MIKIDIILFLLIFFHVVFNNFNINMLKMDNRSFKRKYVSFSLFALITS